jgi:putative flippase GtrA
MVRTAAIDVREFVRFVLTGIAAAVGNITIVWLARSYLTFDTASITGIVGGLLISFVLSKLFAFGSNSLSGTGREAARFLAVYLSSSAVYWGVAVLTERLVRSQGGAAELAEIGGLLFGAGTMMLSSYIGHRFVTFRTYQRAAKPLVGAQ